MKPCTVDLVLLAALEQFKYQAINRLLFAALEGYEDSGTTQKLRHQPKCYHQLELHIFIVNDYNKKCEVENEN